jgi:hypothetical protein
MIPQLRSKLVVSLGCLVACLAVLPVAPAAGQENKKLTTDEVVARHLESIGSKEARAAVSHRVVGGPVKYVIRLGGGGYLDGGGLLVSSGPKVSYTMKFPNSEYPIEQMGFDGAKAESGFLPAGGRTPLSLFLNQQNLPLKEGLFGGVLSVAWPLGRIEQSQPRLEYRGLKKLDGKETYSLGYKARKGGSDLKIAMYFDPATFRHIRTEYKFEIGARLGEGGANDSTRVQESYYTLIEDFDDFRAVDGLTLPHKYRLQLSVNTSGGSLLRDWSLAVEQISHKVPIEDSVFKVR